MLVIWPIYAKGSPKKNEEGMIGCLLLQLSLALLF